MRFSLRTLLIATAAVALVCCVFFALPNWLTATILLLSAFLAPVVAVSTVVFARGYWRAFGIGSLAIVGFWPLISGYMVLIIVFSGGSDLSDILESLRGGTSTADITGMKIGFAVIYSLVGIAGLTSVAVRWLAVRSQNREVSKDLTIAEENEPSPLDRYEVHFDRVSTSQTEPDPLPDPLSEGF